VTLIGVHNRRGDMVNDKSLIKHGFSVATKEYLAKAVEWYEIVIRLEVAFQNNITMVTKQFGQIFVKGTFLFRFNRL
jgi:hypothetical protein